VSEEENQHIPPPAEPKPGLRISPKFARVYKSTALIFFNTALLVLFVAGIVFLVRHLKPKEKPQNPLDKYGPAKLEAAYPERSREEIVSLLTETWGRPLIYEPYTQFTEAPYRGKYVNVADAGYRKVENQGPWPPAKENLNVFVLGGSTTFGYGVADSETIPSALQRKIRAAFGTRVCVYNFGCGFYYSTQERILFSNLLAAGLVPDVAVFIDGLNEFGRRQDVPEFSSHLTQVLNAYFGIHEKASKKSKRAPILLEPPGDATHEGTDQETALTICRRYLRNRDLIAAMARAYGVKTVFVWQPVPTYKYDLKYHPFRADLAGVHDFSHMGYETMAQLRQTSPPPTNELWLADMQETAHELLYVDAVHYSPKMCERIASEIERFLRERSLASPASKR
jgi:lysophospholipase L1-like esterase